MADQTAKAVYLPRHTLLTQLRFAIRIRLNKFLAAVYLRIMGFPGIRNPSIQPNFTKTYPCRPKLDNRIFIPKSYKSGDPPMPLYLSIHGGGFALASPRIDDTFCSNFSDKNKVLVVSLDYPKSPNNKFPRPTEAIVDLVHAVLGDESLPFDPTKVAMGGFSAGANLSLSVSQHKSLRGKISGVVSYYPPADFSYPIDKSIEERPEEAPPDMLAGMADMFNWAYIRPDQDLKDPLLSPVFAAKENLPPKIFIIGCEYDMLCRNAKVMAENFANARGDGKRMGKDDAWEKNGIKWELILGEEHAFDMVLGRGEAIKARRQRRRIEMYDGAAEWLFREVWMTGTA
ncbi:hypothetical protein HYALB_00002364 [Hymenoscyphus albidus]|uniref:Alpha/beta hydrolase fold-3 domain-containing protein n=1 Tax=Hymenoscyphus albidus TaxID=595503 RepID=A0A9N9LR83_9HELO|nr:hypothetical protein HYALB_00002364 [Hymenoscyphus albidus]